MKTNLSKTPEKSTPLLYSTLYQIEFHYNAINEDSILTEILKGYLSPPSQIHNNAINEPFTQICD